MPRPERFDALCAGACGYVLEVALFREIRPPERADYQLTPHELRILRLLVERIYEKLQVHSKSEAVAKALRNRLV